MPPQVLLIIEYTLGSDGALPRLHNTEPKVLRTRRDCLFQIPICLEWVSERDVPLSRGGSLFYYMVFGKMLPTVGSSPCLLWATQLVDRRSPAATLLGDGLAQFVASLPDYRPSLFVPRFIVMDERERLEVMSGTGLLWSITLTVSSLGEARYLHDCSGLDSNHKASGVASFSFPGKESSCLPVGSFNPSEISRS